MNNISRSISLLLLLALFSLSVAGCTPSTPSDDNTPDNTENVDTDTNNTELPDAQAGTFANWLEDNISYSPKVPAYEINIPPQDPDSGNVKIYDNIYMSEEEIQLLNEYGFLVNIDRSYDEFFALYEENRYALQANFITTDSVLHTYHLFFNYLLESLEKNELYDVALNLSTNALKHAQDQYEELKNTDFEQAAKRNIAFFAVAQKLLDPNVKIPDLVKSEVEAELKMIEEHQGIAPSNIFGNENDLYLEDYSQYIPRGHYNKNEKLKQYFNALMWYGRLTFRQKSVDETASALLIVSMLKNNSEILKDFDRLFEPINFFVGEPDDLTFYDYYGPASEVFGENYQPTDLTTEKINQFLDKAKDLRAPGINSMVVFDPDFIENDREEEIKGFRFMGQRSTVDAMIFQKLVYRDVEENPQGDKRMLPMALDIPATFGSNVALEILEQNGATEFQYYEKNMNEMKEFLQKMPQDNWTKNLYWGWMNTLRELTNEYGEGYPSFMTNQAWNKKELLTFLGSFTELKHDTILYAKQVYAELGGGPGGEEVDDRGYVEPNPELYNKMKALINMTIEGLKMRDILSEKNEDLLNKMKEMVEKLRDISIKELENQPLSEDDYEFIRSFGGSLEHFFYETLSDEDKGKEQRELLNGHPSSIIADIATDPNCCVLEEAVGRISSIYVVFPIEDELHLAKGGVYSHYEFSWPMNDRLTDEKWRQILHPWDDMNYDPDKETFEPEIAEWQNEFTLAY